MTNAIILEEFADRHEEIHEQLEVAESWLERLPFDDLAARKRVMAQIVAFLERYALVDANWEEEHLFPLIGDRSVVLSTEHRYIARAVEGLGALARAADPEPTLFRRTAFKLFGLLEAHMDCEERLLATDTSVTSHSHARHSQTD